MVSMSACGEEGERAVTYTIRANEEVGRCCRENRNVEWQCHAVEVVVRCEDLVLFDARD